MKLQVKFLTHALAQPVLVIFNNSFSQDFFVDCCKIATETPKHESESKQKVANLRSNSVPPILSTVFERIIYNRIQSSLLRSKSL